MEILNPELIWINNICYRVPALQDGSQHQAINFEGNDPPPYVEDPEDLRPTLCMKVVDEPPTMENDIELTESGSYRLELPIPKIFWGRLVGQKGMARRRVEDETRTRMSIPRPTQDGPVVITGNCKSDVLLAKAHVEDNVRAGRQFLSYTHFLSISMVNQETLSNFAAFKTRVMEMCPTLKEELFTPPPRLHLTIVMLCLIDNRERQEAIEMLNRLQKTLIEKVRRRAIEVNVKGLDAMNDDPSRVSILYAKVDDPLIQELANTAAAYYHDTGYVKQRDIRDFVKLHVTLMNTRYLNEEEKQQERGQRFRRPPRVEFDASRIFQELKDFDFGKVTVNRVRMSQLGNHSPDDGYYVSSAEIDLYD